MNNITLTFRLSGPVTPEFFAQRVAEACFSYGALHPDEAVISPDDSGREFRDSGKSQADQIRNHFESIGRPLPKWLVRNAS